MQPPTDRPGGRDLVLPADCEQRFEPVRQLAQGGFGCVWLARQRELARDVAVKLIHPALLGDGDQVRRFADEARITAALSHRNIVTVYDHGAEDGIPWIAYEYLPGESLRALIGRRALSGPAAIDAAIQVAAALEEAHAKGVLHRDLKPENILQAAPGWYKVTDFGIAKCLSGEGVRTRTGWLLGTPGYMPPEQILGQPLSPASDVYALGVILFELLAGRLPFEGASLADLLTRTATAPAPDPRSFVPSLSPRLATIVLGALEKDPARRCRSAADLRNALEACQDQQAAPPPPSCDEPGPTARSGRTSRPTRPLRPRASSQADTTVIREAPGPPSGRRRGPVAAAVGLALAVVAVTVAVSRREDPPVPPPTGPASRPGGPSPAVPAGGSPASPPASATAAPRPPGRPGEVPAGNEPPYTRYCERFLDRLPMLYSSSPGTVKATITSMRRQASPIDLGALARPWCDWITIGRWLDDRRDTREVVPELSGRGAVDEFDELGFPLIGAQLAKLGQRHSPRLVQVSLQLVSDYPLNGHTWLALGWTLDLEARLAAAIRCYRHGLGLLGRTRDALQQNDVVYSGLARALLTVPGHDIRKDWPGWLERAQNKTQAMRNLANLLEDRWPGLLLDVLEASVSHPTLLEASTRTLAQLQLKGRCDPARVSRLLAACARARGSR